MSTQVVTVSKVCDTCQKQRPLTNFAGRGKHTTKDGTTITYREPTCRKCARDIKRKNNICRMCHSPTRPESSHCEKHLQLMRDCMKRRKIRDKSAAFAHYGQKCTYCEDQRQLFLTIDHIKNNGAEHRRQQRAGNNHGHDIYAWLRKNQYPEGFQTLCYNCNCVKTHIGEEALLNFLRESKTS